MASSSNLDPLIRKLRKKLRQIENLERLNRPLSDEEIIKVDSKFSIRDQLQEALEERQHADFLEDRDDQPDTPTHSHSQDEGEEDTPSFIPDESGDGGFQQIGDKEQESFRHDSQQGRSQNLSTSTAALSSQTDRSSRSAITEQSGQSDTSGKTSKAKKKPVKSQSPLARSHCKVSWLEGHSDLVTSLVVIGQKVVTASRDTTLKCWDVATGPNGGDGASYQEIRSYGGHTETVTCVQVIEATELEDSGKNLSGKDKIVVSGSFDCTFKLWNFTTGELIKSVYTYNPVTKICYSTDLHRLITGSDGGKLELWNLASGDNSASARAHDAALTGIQTRNDTIFSSSADGIIKVHKVQEGKQLSCVFVSEDMKSDSGHAVIARHIRCLSLGPKGLLFGDDARNLKILDWKKGQVSKVPNHVTNYTSTDAICCHDDYVMTSSYDLDTGLGYVNVRSADTLEYLATLDDRETERVVCLDFGRTAANKLFIVTGGMDLKLWQVEGSSSNKKRSGSDEEDSDMTLEFRSALAQRALDSESESSEDEDDDSDDDGDGDGRSQRTNKRDSSAEKNPDAGWFSWCNIL